MLKYRGYLLSDLIRYNSIKSWIKKVFRTKHYLDMFLRSRDAWRLEAPPNIVPLKKEYDPETSLIINYGINPNRQNGHIEQPVIIKNYSWGDRIEFLRDILKRENYKRVEYMVEGNKLESMLSKIGLEDFTPIKKRVNKDGYPEPEDNLLQIAFGH